MKVKSSYPIWLKQPVLLLLLSAHYAWICENFTNIIHII